MRVLCVGNRCLPWSEGGYEVVWASAVATLRARGHQTRVLSAVPDRSDRVHTGPPPQDVHRELRWYWRDHAFPAIGLRACVGLERANSATLRRHLEQFAPDVVCWWAMGGMSLSLLEQVRRAGVPAVAVVGDEWPIYGPRVDAWTGRWQRRGRPAARLAEAVFGIPTALDLDRAAGWLFNSGYLLAETRHKGWRLADAEILPPGVDPLLFAAEPPDGWRGRLLYSGRLDPRKGVETAIEAMTRLPEATLTISGDGDDAVRSALASLAGRLGVVDRVRFARHDHDQMPAVYAAADAVVFPVSWREPWGLVPLEAMASGRPVLASRAGGGPAEYLEDGRNCVQFDPGDAPALAAAVDRLAADAALRERLIGAGRETASRFTERRFHDELERQLELGRLR